MKTVLRFLAAACLILGLTSSCLASPHSLQGYFGDFRPLGDAYLVEIQMGVLAPGEGLFSTEEQGPRFLLQGYFGYNGPDVTMVGAEYYLNDFIFGDLAYVENPGGEATYLRGGYLWEELGVFAAFEYLAMDGESEYIVSGGYRFDLGNGGYAALSVDYYGGEYGDTFAVEAAVKYFADGLKLSGQLYVYEDGDFFGHAKANVAAGDNLVWGGGLNFGDGYFDAFLGLTWSGENVVFDGLIGGDDEGDFRYYLSYLYSFSDAFAAGINYLDGDGVGDGIIGLKGQYQLGDGALVFSYTTSIENAESGYIGLSYEMSL